MGRLPGFEDRAAIDEQRAEPAPLDGLGRGSAPGRPIVERPALPRLPASRRPVSGTQRPDESRLTSSPPRVSPRTVSMLDVRELRAYDGVNLGVYGPAGTGEELLAAVRPGFTGRSSVDEMMEAYLPNFWGWRRLGWEEAASNVKHISEDLKVRGLFWDEGWGPAHRGTLWALVLLHLHADLVWDPTESSGFSAEELRDRLERGKVKLRLRSRNMGWGFTYPPLLLVDEEQRFRVQRLGRGTHGVYAATYAGRIHVYPPSLLYTFSADYFFWHACRLHAWAAESGEPRASLAGELCARAGMAEIAEYAAVLVHEYTHDYRDDPWECGDGVYHRAGCATYFHQFTFLHRVMAMYVLPQARDEGYQGGEHPRPVLYHVYGAPTEDSGPRHAWRAGPCDGGEVPSEDRTGLTADLAANGSPLSDFPVVALRRQRFWASHSPVDVSWSVPDACVTLGESTPLGTSTRSTPILRPA